MVCRPSRAGAFLSGARKAFYSVAASVLFVRELLVTGKRHSGRRKRGTLAFKTIKRPRNGRFQRSTLALCPLLVGLAGEIGRVSAVGRLPIDGIKLTI